jgi:hypothetical protein
MDAFDPVGLPRVGHHLRFATELGQRREQPAHQVGDKHFTTVRQTTWDTLGGMPLRWVTRRDVEGKEVAPSLRCHIEGAIVAEIGLRSVEECVAELLTEEETAVGSSDWRPVMKAGQLDGYIEITR